MLLMRNLIYIIKNFGVEKKYMKILLWIEI